MDEKRKKEKKRKKKEQKKNLLFRHQLLPLIFRHYFFSISEQVAGFGEFLPEVRQQRLEIKNKNKNIHKK